MLPDVSRVFDQIPLSQRERTEFSRAFKSAARKKGWSPDRADRLEAWVLAFLAWGCRQKPCWIGLGHIGSFEEALRSRPYTEEEEIQEAMDAVAFLFGAAHEARAVLARVGLLDQAAENRVPTPSSEPSNRHGRIQTLQIGWRGEKEASKTEARTTRNAESADDAAEDEEDTPTAELLIRRYQNRLESVHEKVA